MWLGGLLTVLVAVLYWLYRTKRLEVGSKFNLSDIANFVSVLLAIFALAFTLAAQYQPQAEITARFQQGLTETAPSIELLEGETSELQIKRGAGRLFLLLRNMGEAPLRRPVYIITATPATVHIQCAEEFPQFRPSTEPNVCQFNSPQDISPDSQRKIPSAFGFDFVAPNTLTQYRLELMLQSENLSLITYIVKVHIMS